MAQRFVIIDGYNLMHAAGLARHSYGPGDLETCRNRLLQQLRSRLSETVVHRTTVVFDAFQAIDDSDRQQNRHGLTVIYAPAGSDADSEMERLITSHSAPRQLLIVSSDHRLHRAARRRKATAIDSEPFWESLVSGPHSTAADLLSPTGHHKPSSSDEKRKSDRQERSSAGNNSEFDADYLSDLESEFGDGDLF